MTQFQLCCCIAELCTSNTSAIVIGDS